MDAGKVQGIIFDNDGTLVDTGQLILDSFRHATRQVLGQEFPEERLMAKVGQPLSVQMWDYTDDEAVHDALLTSFREYNHSIHDQVVSAFPGVIDGLAELKRRGYRLGVVSSKLHALCWRGLTIVGAAPYLDFCIGADDFPEFKPKPGPILYGAEKLGLPIDRCVYVGDAPFDIAAGNAAGCATVACTWGIFAQEALEAESPTATVHSFAELVDLFE